MGGVVTQTTDTHTSTPSLDINDETKYISHMKIKNILALPSIAMLLLACTSDHVCEAEQIANSPKAITFCPSEAASRAATTGSNDLQTNGFRVYANVSTDGSSEVSALMKGTDVRYVSGDVWTYAPIMYWPIEADKKMDFYALYGYDDPNVSTVYGWDKKPHSRYTVNNDVQKQTDFLWAAPVVGVTPDTNIGGSSFTYGSHGIPFSFRHPLSGVNVVMKDANISYVSGSTTYTNLQEALVALNPTVGADYESDYIHSIEIHGAFAPYADIDADATDIDNVWRFPSGPWAEKKYTLLASDDPSVTEMSSDFEIYRASDGLRSTASGMLCVLPCGDLNVTLVINHVVKCLSGDYYLIRATTNKVLNFKAEHIATYNVTYNPVNFISDMTKLSAAPVVGTPL